MERAVDTQVSEWDIASPITTIFDFDYTSGRDHLLRLYDRGTRRQWVGNEGIDWSLDVDPSKPVGMPDETVPIFGTPSWQRMSRAEKDELHRHIEAWRFSQFVHGEQGARSTQPRVAARRRHHRQPLARAVNAYVMQDEARSAASCSCASCPS
jgi:hypothetical protein